MGRTLMTYSIGTECYAIITSSNDLEFLLPVKIIILDKSTVGNHTYYKVKIRDILEKNFESVKENFYNIRLKTKINSENTFTVIKKMKLDSIQNMVELLTYLNDKTFYIEDIFITLDRQSLKDLYNRFVKYIISYHYRKLYQLMGRTFLMNEPIFINNKEIFKRRVDKIGFGDIFEKYDLNIEF